MSYDWKIELDGVDISDKVSKVSVLYALSNFCGEMSIDINDPDYYTGLDFSQISESPEIEIFTKNGSTFISHGLFFIERPAITSTTQGDLMQGVWGRSITALLTEPFAIKVTKSWETQTTFFAICEEMCALAGLDFDSAYSEISDFVIYPYTYEADGLYPADVISELAGLAGAIATTDRAGHVCIKQIVYSPSVADETLTDADISEISESPEWPVFANRVRITPTGSIASYGMDMIIPEQCMQADAVAKHKIFVRVTDSDGEPVDGIVVNWTHDATSATLQNATSNTQDIIIKNEKQQATGYYDLKVDMPPSSILGVYAAADTAKNNNFATAGYTLDGETITLISKLKFCDQTLIVDYVVGGIAVNYMQAGYIAEDVTVTADVEGQRASKTIYINNPCQCAPVVKLSAAPTSVQIAGQSQMLVYVEEGGPVTTGRMVYMSEQTSIHRGALRWTTARLGSVLVSGEKTVSINEINGITQCEISMYPASITSVYRVNSEGISFGPNLYDSHDGKIITLTTVIASELDLKVWYYAIGVARNLFTGKKVGKALIKASIESSREAGASDSIEIDVVNKEDPTGTPPGDYDPDEDDGDYGGPGGTDDEEDDEYDPNAEDPAETGGDFNFCVPDAGATADRFTEGLAHDCSCEEMCNTEFDIYGTTQGYDGASGKTIAALALAQCGEGCEEGSPAYWEKYAELKAAAIANCVAQCDVCTGTDPLVWDTVNNPETIVAGSSVSIAVTGGLGPYTWSTSSNGYTLLASETETGENQVTCAEGVCGTNYDVNGEISITDACGNTVTGVLRNTGGQWAYQGRGAPMGVLDAWYCDSSDCGITAGGTLIAGKGKWVFNAPLVRRWCFKSTGGWELLFGTLWVDPPCGTPLACIAAHTTSDFSGCGEPYGCSEGATCIPWCSLTTYYEWSC
jgi:hypothetical protein